jgi:hypothetical protein
MKKTALFCFLMLLNLVFLQAQIKKGSSLPLPDVQLNAVNSELKESIKDYKLEKGLLIVFSCNTCPFVVGTPDFPGWERQYNNLYEKANQNSIGMILVNSNEGKRGKEDSFVEMKKRADEKGYKMPYLLDENSRVANAFEAKTTPHVYLFNNDLKLVYSGSIDNIWDNKRTEDIPYLFNAMKALSEGKKIKPSATPPKGCSIKRIQKK